jgi:molecular chaperone DnaJ
MGMQEEEAPAHCGLVWGGVADDGNRLTGIFSARFERTLGSVANGYPDEDCYAVLGVQPTASVAEIRRAWRKLALRWHPDRAGTRATKFFQKLAAAYEVLSDPLARAAYDRRRGPPAPARAGAAAQPAPAAPVTRRRPAPPVMLSRLSGSLNTLLACGAAQYADEDVIELLVNAQEASQGGMASISLWVPVRCPSCARGVAGSCARCGGTRMVDELFSAWLAVPPGVADGTLLTPSALLSGMVRPVSFRARVDAVGSEERS